jgi:hypothetical protein
VTKTLISVASVLKLYLSLTQLSYACESLHTHALLLFLTHHSSADLIASSSAWKIEHLGESLKVSLCTSKLSENTTKSHPTAVTSSSAAPLSDYFLKMKGIWDVTLCHWANSFSCFEGF